MKIIKLLILIVSLPCFLQAQTTPSKLVNEMNRMITLYGDDQGEILTLVESIGMLEQKTTARSVQRIKLSDIGSLQVIANKDGCSVTFRCADSTLCINIIKPDMSTATMPSNAFFFVNAKSGNDFARLFESLIGHYTNDKAPVKALLAEEVNAQPSRPAGSAVSETKSKSNKVRETEEADQEEDEEETKIKSGGKKNTIKKVVDDAENETTEEQKPVKKTKTSKKEEEPNDDEVTLDTPTDPRESSLDQQPGMEPLCMQLEKIFQAGKKNKFKDLIGKETNAELKINESKIRLKGFKRNYISWYRNQRAFIAEYKTSNERELIVEEFGSLQTQLEDCLGGWEDSDRSGDEIYASVTEEVKDLEYKKVSDPTMPSLRILISTDAQKKHTLFIRIQ